MSLEDHSAPGQAAAYTFQFERALYWLSQSPAGTVVGIETSDDVSVLDNHGCLTLEQDKHSIQKKAQPFGDRSYDLWNTLDIWLSALKAGELESGKTRFLMATNKNLPDCISKRISKAESLEEIEACIVDLREAAREPSAKIEKLAERVLDEMVENHLKEIIENCELVDEEQNASGAALRIVTVENMQIPEYHQEDSESILDELLGWLIKSCLHFWRQKQPAWITRQSFVNQFHAVLENRKRNRSRERAAHLITVIDDEIGYQKGSIFVKQICEITNDTGRIDESIREFIRCNIEKSRLSIEGNITDKDWTSFENTLETRWEKIFSREIRLASDLEDEDVGFKIFSETTDHHKEKLAGVDTEQVYLTAGTYHRLADRLILGWHPKYKEIFDVEE